MVFTKILGMKPATYLGLKKSGNFPQVPRFDRNPGWIIPGIGMA
jgi:hypothetical protein